MLIGDGIESIVTIRSYLKCKRDHLLKEGFE